MRKLFFSTGLLLTVLIGANIVDQKSASYGSFVGFTRSMVLMDSLPSKQASKAPKPTAISKLDYEGTWKGNERCQGISAAVAFIIISPKNENEVFIKGIYSTEGDITGLWKGGVINIPRQSIPDPLFKNIRIEGTMTLSKNRKTLSAVFNVLNNDARDQCSAVYSK
ncbi:MAG: hypothetical protein JWO06_4073 [Bacteroidota bacterium]|nr:hypothetical protein [Bacteroidota bacterium]